MTMFENHMKQDLDSRPVQPWTTPLGALGLGPSAGKRGAQRSFPSSLLSNTVDIVPEDRTNRYKKIRD